MSSIIVTYLFHLWWGARYYREKMCKVVPYVKELVIK